MNMGPHATKLFKFIIMQTSVLFGQFLLVTESFNSLTKITEPTAQMIFHIPISKFIFNLIETNYL